MLQMAATTIRGKRMSQTTTPISLVPLTMIKKMMISMIVEMKLVGVVAKAWSVVTKKTAHFPHFLPESVEILRYRYYSYS